MSSSGRIRAMTPLLPWRPAILSPTDSLRFIATYTFTRFALPRQLRSLLLPPPDKRPDAPPLPPRALLEIPQIVLETRVVCRDLQPDHRLVGHLLQELRGQHGALLHQPLAAVLVEQVGAELLPLQHHDRPLLHLVVENADLVLQVLLHHVELFLLDRLGSIVLLDAFAGEDLHADDDSFDPRRADERRIADVSGLLAEDRAQQLFLRGQLR